MKSKILALSKNEEFKSLLKQKKISNKYVTVFFGKLSNKNKAIISKNEKNLSAKSWKETQEAWISI